jgi:ring-1,2-phenylacetyl-CoA epoxidase subunit PaaD
MTLTENKVVRKEDILNALQEVMDPEIPVISVIELGIVGDITIEGNGVKVKIIPTFTACPAIQLMREQIKEKVLSLGFGNVEVELDHSIPWNSDRITEKGKTQLTNFGLGTPLHHHGDFNLDDIQHSKCPYCGSIETTMNSIFGSTLCRSMHYCFDCKQAFERFKPL